MYVYFIYLYQCHINIMDVEITKFNIHTCESQHAGKPYSFARYFTLLHTLCILAGLSRRFLYKTRLSICTDYDMVSAQIRIARNCTVAFLCDLHRCYTSKSVQTSKNYLHRSAIIICAEILNNYLHRSIIT